MSVANPYKTVVDMAASTKDLTVKATVKTELGITVSTYDDQLDAHIHQVSALMADYRGPDFASEKVTDSFRWTRSNALDCLWLSRAPVTTIHAVVEDGTTLGASLYEVNAATGELWRLDSYGDPATWASNALITVQHTSGYVLLTDLPHSIERACIDQVKAVFIGRLRDPTLRSETVPDVYQASYALAGGDNYGKSGLLESVERALDPYRRPIVG